MPDPKKKKKMLSEDALCSTLFPIQALVDEGFAHIGSCHHFGIPLVSKLVLILGGVSFDGLLICSILVVHPLVGNNFIDSDLTHLFIGFVLAFLFVKLEFAAVGIHFACV